MPEQNAIMLCFETGWTYEEYLDQPEPFIKHMMAMIRAKNEAQRDQNK